MEPPEMTHEDRVKQLRSIASRSSEWKTLGDAVFDVDMLNGTVEFALWELTRDALGWEPEKISFDYYDRSFEIHGAPAGFVPSAEQLEKMWALGPSQLWIHEDPEERRKPGERFYVRPLK